jgi:diacylglycerol kinase (ATP)
MPKHALIKSFGFAFKGLKLALNERNFLLHIISAMLVIIAGLFFRISATEWCVLLLCIGVVMTAELINTAIEKLVDMVSPGFNVTAGQVKDLSAAAVLLFSLISAIIGLLVFYPYIMDSIPEY